VLPYHANPHVHGNMVCTLKKID
ncbi:hypothetical protein JL09_g6368, partial [Pichia kudriavzevii]